MEVGFLTFIVHSYETGQAKAGGEILEGRNVIVCAPTGAGKTVVGEMALFDAFHQNKKAIYTTPLKALSNQKYAELRKMFGAEHVGLATGDMSINRGAQIMVMTTEVYRNMAWRAMDDNGNYHDEDEEHEMNDDLSMRGRNELSDLKVVVLDEFHYMGQKGRGGVWEESVITSPAHTQIVGLSATLPNAHQLGRWMEHVTERKTTLVEATGGRPVPLRYLFATRDGVEPMFQNADAGPGSPLGLLGLRGDGVPEMKSKKTKGRDFDPEQSMPKGLDLNPKLKAMIRKRSETVNRMVAKKAVVEKDKFRRGDENDERRSKMNPRRQMKERERLLKIEMRKAVPSLHFTLRKLVQRDLVPAIFFIFSRARCDEAAANICLQMRKGEKVKKDGRSPQYKSGKGRQRSARKQDAAEQDSSILQDNSGRSFRTNSKFVTEETVSSIFDSADISMDDISNPLEESNLSGYADRGLLTYTQVKEVATRIKAFNRENEEIKFTDESIDRLLHGVFSHHAGQLPAHKDFVEILFRAQLMKVVFATETLAAGINMPARTTVITSLAKRGDGGMNPLDTANTLQMAGRAGRRGMDTDGTCVLVATPFEGPEEAIDILTSEINPVESQFSPGYSLSVNLIARGEGKLDVAQKLVQKSFAMWNKQQVENQVETVKQLHGENFDEMVEVAAHEQFLENLKLSIDQGMRRRMFDVLDDKSLLKKASKSFAGLYQILNLEESTLSYLTKELETMTSIDSVMDNDEMVDFLSEDNVNVKEEIARQEKRIRKARQDVSDHIMTAMAVEANTILRSPLPIANDMKAALAMSRKDVKDVLPDENVTPLELTKFAKSAVTMNRKRRKGKNTTKNIGIDDSSLISVLNAVEENDESLDDLMALINTLEAYGCIVSSDESDSDVQSYRITTAGENIGLLGVDNALWFLTALGGAWDQVGASDELDKFKNIRMDDESFLLDERLEDDFGLFDDDNLETNTISEDVEEDKVLAVDTVPLPQSEASTLTDQLRNLEPCEIAGYVSCLVADGGRRGGSLSVLAAFQQLTPSQQRVIQSSLLALERLTEAQNKYSVDESTSKVSLELGKCDVVTAWAGGCSWNEALELTGSPEAPGDLVRILHRALDALRQIGNLPVNAVRSTNASAGIVQSESPGVHPDIRRLCRDAATAMDRFPVKEQLAFNDEEEEEEEDEDDEDEDEGRNSEGVVDEISDPDYEIDTFIKKRLK